VEAGRIDCIVVYKIDRLSRSLMDFARIMEVLERHGVSLVSVTQQFNTTSSMGRLTLNILLSFAQFEREIISERTRDKMAAARRKGKWTGGPPVLGYDIVRDRAGSRLAVNHGEAERVRAIFRLYLEEGSLLPTLRAIRERGWKTKRYMNRKGAWRGGCTFDKSTLLKLLTNVLYLGKAAYKGDVFEGEHESIVDEDLFGRVQGLLRHNRNSGGSLVRNKHRALLKGLVRCKHCGCAMSHHFATRGVKRYRYYVCMKAQKEGWNTCPAPSLPAKELEDFVLGEIRALGRDGRVLEEALAATQAHLQADIDALERQRKVIEGRIRGLSREIGTLAPQAGYDKAATQSLARLQEQMREEEDRAAGFNQRIEKIRRRMFQPDELAGAVEAFDPLWNTLSPTDKARLVHLLVERIEYDGEAEAISITFHPTGISTLAEQPEEDKVCQPA